ncbi:amidohydrolase family protein [Amycolatopsis sp. A1MSW2902]|uniref:amidohydrolase family protein n=1 Tax=Amycolatopsis sp. A1MSW2902 TaxID=687413 RepID=UPI00307E0674
MYDRPVPPLAKMRAAGANAACGNDGIRDLWGPYGDGDMLTRTMHLAYRSSFRTDPEIELALHAATYGGAKALRLKDYGLRIGDRADFFLVAAEYPAEAVVSHPPRQLVVKGGAVVSRR